MIVKNFRQSLLIAVCFAVASLPAIAQEAAYPNRPIRFLVPFSPGGLGDTLARAIGQHLSERFSQPVVVENRPGASQILASEATAKAPPDGYTIMIGSQGGMVINTVAKKKLPYDPVKDFAPITMLVTSPLNLVVHPSVQANSVPELIALAKAQPGKLTYASIGNGSAMHLAGEMFKSLAGVDIMHVPYRGSGHAIVDVASGQVSMMFEGAPSSMPYVRQGKIKLLATSGTSRVKDSGYDVPTVSETVPGYQLVVWFGLVAPAGTPRPIVDRLNREVTDILRLPAMRKLASNMGTEIAPSTPEELGARIRKEVKEAAALAKAAGIVPE